MSSSADKTAAPTSQRRSNDVPNDSSTSSSRPVQGKADGSKGLASEQAPRKYHNDSEEEEFDDDQPDNGGRGEGDKQVVGIKYDSEGTPIKPIKKRNGPVN